MFLNLKRIVALGSIIACSFPLSSCRIITHVKNRQLTSTFEKVVDSLSSHPDPETVRQSFPTFLILIDALVLSDPNNLDLLHAGTSAYDMYCQAFLVNESDIERTAKLYQRAKDYGIRLLDRSKILTDAHQLSITDFERELRLTTFKDVPYLYAAASAWLGWILANSDSMNAFADLPKAIALAQRVIELDEGYNNGAPHLIFGIYYAVQPRGAGQDLEKSNYHFQRAIELGGENNILPLVTYAEYYATGTLDEALFSNLLNQASQVDLQKQPEIRLLNELSLQRVHILLEQKDEFF